MEKFFSISKTAETAGMTAETLRYYDRIGLVTPSKTDKNTGYRYYSQAEIVRLNTIKALRSMDLTLSEIRNILEYDDLKKIAEALKQTEAKADKKNCRVEGRKKQNPPRKKFLRKQALRKRFFGQYFPERVSSPRHSFVGQAERPHCRQSVELSQAFLRPFDARNQGRFLV